VKAHELEFHIKQVYSDIKRQVSLNGMKTDSPVTEYTMDAYVKIIKALTGNQP